MFYKRKTGGRKQAEREFANAAATTAVNHPDAVIEAGKYAASTRA